MNLKIFAVYEKAYGAKADGNLNFSYFCEGQLVQDNVMAITALDYLKANPESVVVKCSEIGRY